MLNYLLSIAAPVIVALLSLISLSFLFRFILPAIFIIIRLHKVNKEIKLFPVNNLNDLYDNSSDNGNSNGNNDDKNDENNNAEIQYLPPDNLTPIMQKNKILNRLWRDYRQTLHPISNRGGESNIQWRSTTNSSQFFNEAAIVDFPLRTEFYKHLPGILTGIGIIGTFAGLILGLTQFDVSADPILVRESLKNLIRSVGHAFQVSASAIFLAMLFTWIEKSLITQCYKQVNELVTNLDTHFAGGLENDYLARLVRSNEMSAQQIAQLRQQMLLMNSNEEQKGDKLDNAKLAEIIGKSVARGVALAVERTLTTPLLQVSETLENFANNTNPANSLKPTLERFLAKIETLTNSINSSNPNSADGEQGKFLAALSKSTSQLEKSIADIAKLGNKLEATNNQSVQTAATQLQSAGKGVGIAAQNFSSASDQMIAAAGSLTAATLEASSIMNQQKEIRDSLALLVAEVKNMLNDNKRELSINQNMVNRLAQAAATLGQSERLSKEYLDSINEILTVAHQSFADNIENTLKTANTQFQQELAMATDYLRGAIEDLGDTLSELRVKV